MDLRILIQSKHGPGGLLGKLVKGNSPLFHQLEGDSLHIAPHGRGDERFIIGLGYLGQDLCGTEEFPNKRGFG